MKENWRTTLPLPVLVVIFCVAYGVTYLFDLVAGYFSVAVPPEAHRIRMIVLGIFSILHGGFRVFVTHPSYDTGYRKWLSVTPWSPRQPLPKGPIHLIWTDAIVLATLSLLAYSNIVELAAVPIVAFLAAYLLLLNLAFLGNEIMFLVAALFLGPLTFYPYKDVFVAGFVLVGLYVLARIGLHQYFKGFPWNTEYWKVDLIEELRRNALRQNVIDWPFRSLLVFDGPVMPWPAAFLISLIITWWGHVFLWAEGIALDEEPQLTLVMTAILAMLIALLRFVAYGGPYRPPINLLGRIVTGRLIIPRYDKIFIGPFCVAAAGTALPVTLVHLGFSAEWGIKTSFFVVFFLTFALPPSLKTWRLTGAHQMTRPIQRVQSKGSGGRDPNLGGFLSQRPTTSRQP